jgi:hypothetical protein
MDDIIDALNDLNIKLDKLNMKLDKYIKERSNG